MPDELMYYVTVDGAVMCPDCGKDSGLVDREIYRTQAVRATKGGFAVRLTCFRCGRGVLRYQPPREEVRGEDVLLEGDQGG